MQTLIKAIGAVVLIAIVSTFFAALLAFPVEWLWNWLMPTLFKLPVINVWQALGLTTLTGILFKSSATTSK